MSAKPLPPPHTHPLKPIQQQRYISISRQLTKLNLFELKIIPCDAAVSVQKPKENVESAVLQKGSCRQPAAGRGACSPGPARLSLRHVSRPASSAALFPNPEARAKQQPF